MLTSDIRSNSRWRRADLIVEFLLRLPPEYTVSPSDRLSIYALISDVVLLTR